MRKIKSKATIQINNRTVVQHILHTALCEHEHAKGQLLTLKYGDSSKINFLRIEEMS